MDPTPLPSLGPDARLVHRLPDLAEYRALSESVGWGEVMDFDAAPASLARSLHGVVVEEGGRAVAMGRLVGDGAIYLYVQDVAVRPERQGRGLGRAIVGALLDHVRAGASPKAFVGLFAAGGTEPFYRSFGFDEYPGMTGMFLVAGQLPGRLGTAAGNPP